MADDEEHEYGANELMIACETEDVDSALTFIQSGTPGVTSKDNRGRTALHYCAEFNTVTDIAEALIKKKRNLTTVKDKHQVTPLHLAVIAGNLAMCELLLGNKADINAADAGQHNVIHLATAHGHVDLLQFLADKGAKLNRPDHAKAFPLHYAVQLCENASSTGGAVEKKSKDKGKKGKDKKKKKGSDASEIALAKPPNGLEVLAKLLQLDTDQNCRDADERTPLIWAASSGLKRAAEMILDDGAQINMSDRAGMTELHAAVSRNHADMVNFLIKRGADVNVPDKKGCTPLFYAVSLDFTDIANTLLRFDANPNHQDIKGRTPSHCAAARGNSQMLTILLHANADLWLQTVKGDYPIHEATIAKETETVIFILDVTPDNEAINRTNNSNSTILHLAAVANNKKLCSILVKKGANKDIEMSLPDGANLTALQAAILKHAVDAASVLDDFSSPSPPPEEEGTPTSPKPEKSEKKKEKKEKKDKKKKKKGK